MLSWRLLPGRAPLSPALHRCLAFPDLSGWRLRTWQRVSVLALNLHKCVVTYVSVGHAERMASSLLSSAFVELTGFGLQMCVDFSPVLWGLQIPVTAHLLCAVASEGQSYSSFARQLLGASPPPLQTGNPIV